MPVMLSLASARSEKGLVALGSYVGCIFFRKLWNFILTIASAAGKLAAFGSQYFENLDMQRFEER